MAQLLELSAARLVSIVPERNKKPVVAPDFVTIEGLGNPLAVQPCRAGPKAREKGPKRTPKG